FPCFTLLSLPRSTLFPYTTLFRSTGAVAPLRSVQIVVGWSNAPFAANLVLWLVATPLVGRHLFVFDPTLIQFERWRPTKGVATRDRKSTRLNSSHGSISYAVFCLK